MLFPEAKTSTEPFSFIFLKRLCSLSLVIAILIYTYNQFSKFTISTTKPNLISSIKHINYGNIAIRICSIIPINCNYSSNILSIDYVDFNSNLNYTNPEPKQCETTGPIINSYVPHICKNGGESYYYTFDYLMENRIVITPNITEAYLGGFKIDKVYPSSGFNLISIIPLFILNEQAAIVYYSPIINKRIFSKYVYGLVGGLEEEFVDFNAHTDHILTNLSTPNTTMLILRPVSKDILYQEEFYYDLASILSSIGGLFSFLSGVFVFLFGATKLAPWGFLQTYVFNYLCTEYRRKLVRKLKNKYEPIPFISGRTKNVTLEERVQNIENMLKEYYLDTDFLNLLVEDNNKVNDKADNKV
ncbi:unnamed protein product [Rhizophagus irregularis]|nr:unnamed protein product [Rhizophagus irregularis]CAB5377570.1 unnamed protein product [Rhizophagus irregularis]